MILIFIFLGWAKIIVSKSIIYVNLFIFTYSSITQSQEISAITRYKKFIL